MGSYTFKWAHPTTDASDVLVTGSFDGWTKSVQLEKKGDVFQKTVEFSDKDAVNKIYYKFVVDNHWTINESYPHEPDHEGNINNFLTSSDLTKSTFADPSALAASPFINTVTPESTTVTEMGKKKNTKNKAAAGKQPAAASNAQPSETAVAAAAAASALKSEPIATPSDIPGGFPETPSNENAKLEEKTVSINPIPASAGTGNPIKLAPGEKIPDSVTAQDVNEHVKLDKASYEKSDALPTAPALDPLATTTVPPVAGVMIPESSLPMGHQSDVNKVTINSTGPGATTAALAGQVPLESKVPAVVKESQEKAGVAPEASASSQEVKEKAQVEQEIKSKIPEAPATSVGTAGVGTEKREENSGTIVGAAVATGGAVVAAAAAALTKLSEDAAPVINNATNATATALDNNLPASVKDKLPVSAQNALATEKTPAPVEEVSPQVPREVKESIVEAGKSPEAAANTTAVQEKKEVESELLRQVLAAPDNHGATSTSDSKPAESKEKEAATETSTKTPSTLSPAAPNTEAKTTAANITEPAGAATPANGNGTESKSSGAAHEKKKHRFSVMINKLKAKLK